MDDANELAALKELPQLYKLETLVLKAFDLTNLRPLLESPVGARLRRLDLHYNYDSPGINLLEIGKCCPLLSDLSVCDSLVTICGDAKPENFMRLISFKLLRVTYTSQDDWEPIPR